MIGKFIDDWNTPVSKYPIEALIVWIVVTFSCTLTYEAIKAYHSHPLPGMRDRLFKVPVVGTTPSDIAGHSAASAGTRADPGERV